MGTHVAGASLDSPIAKSPIGKSPKMPLKPAKVSGSPVTPAPADSLDGKNVTKPKTLNKSGKAEAAGGEAREEVDGSAGTPIGDGAPGEAPSGVASAESEAAVAAGDIAGMGGKMGDPFRRYRERFQLRTQEMMAVNRGQRGVMRE